MSTPSDTWQSTSGATSDATWQPTSGATTASTCQPRQLPRGSHIRCHASNHVAATSAASVANAVWQPDGMTYYDENYTHRWRKQYVIDWIQFCDNNMFRHRMNAHLWRKCPFRHCRQNVTHVPWQKPFRHKNVTKCFMWRFWNLQWRKSSVIVEHIPTSVSYTN